MSPPIFYLFLLKKIMVKDLFVSILGEMSMEELR